MVCLMNQVVREISWMSQSTIRWLSETSRVALYVQAMVGCCDGAGWESLQTLACISGLGSV